MANIDLNNMSPAELNELRAQVDRTIASTGEQDRQRALQAAEDAVRAYGFILADLVSSAGNGRSGSKRSSRSAGGAYPAPSSVKYRNPENPQQTWSGRGRRPQWVHDAVGGNRSLADLAAG